MSGTQVIPTTTPTKVTFAAKDFDPGALYDNVSNFRFIPTTPGYYQVIGSVFQAGGSATGFSAISLYKNGTAYRAGNRIPNNAANVIVEVNSIVPMNGSSDYLEIFYAQTTGGNMTLTTSTTATYFSATFLRGL
jgi:hypothetical protein